MNYLDKLNKLTTEYGFKVTFRLNQHYRTNVDYDHGQNKVTHASLLEYFDILNKGVPNSRISPESTIAKDILKYGTIAELYLLKDGEVGGDKLFTHSFITHNLETAIEQAYDFMQVLNLIPPELTKEEKLKKIIDSGLIVILDYTHARHGLLTREGANKISTRPITDQDLLFPIMNADGYFYYSLELHEDALNRAWNYFKLMYKA